MTAVALVEVKEEPRWPKKALDWRDGLWGTCEVANACQSQLSLSSLVHSAVAWRTLRRVWGSLEKGWQVQRRRIIRNELRHLWTQFCSSRLWELTGAYELFLQILKVTVKSKVHISDSLRNQLRISFSNWQSKIDLKGGGKIMLVAGEVFFWVRVNGLLVVISCMAIKLLGTENNWQLQDSQGSYLLVPLWQTELQMSDEKTNRM